MFISPAAEIERAKRLLGTEADYTCKASETTEGKASAGALTDLFIFAGVGEEKRKAYYLRALLGGGFLALPAVLCGKMLLLPLAAVPALITWQVLRMKVFSRARLFETDYTAMLLSLASAVRTGMDPLAALLQSGKLFSENSEVRKEVQALSELIEKGAPEDSALRDFAKTIQHPDVKLFTTAFILARREGSSLAECLNRLVRVTRQRQSFRRKVKSAVAMQRLSGFGIAGCAGLIAAFQFVTNRDAVFQAFSHPLGLKIICLGLFLIAGGILWMIRMTSSRI